MLEQIRQLLASSDPYTLVGSAAVAVFFLVLTWRKLSPGSWKWLETHIPLINRIESEAIWTFVWKAVQTLPGALMGAAMTAIASGGDLKKTLLGALAGPVAAIGHEVLKAYKGAPSKPGDRGLPPQSFGAAILVGSALGLLAACSLFGSSGPLWPKLGECAAPVGETLFSEVESVLTSSGGNFEDDLLALGKTEGLAFVECAVKAVVEQLSARIAARKPGERITPDEGIGVARGKAFLAKIEAAYK